jgi:hypothetical protein
VAVSFGFGNNVSANPWSAFTPASSPYGQNEQRSTSPSFPSPSYGFSLMPGHVSLPGYGFMTPQSVPGNYPLPFGQNYGPCASSYANVAYFGMPGLPSVSPYVPPYTLPMSQNVPVVNRSAAGMSVSVPCSTATMEAAGASSNSNLPLPGVRFNNPNFQFMTKYDGTKKGLSAKKWINDLEQSRTLYNLFEQQMVPLARLLCTDQARDWAKIQPKKQTWEEFKTAFLREYGEKKQDKLFLEMISFTQGDASVGQYATSMQRYFKQLDIKPQKQMEYFVRNLKMGFRESTFAGHPTDFADAIEIARKAEDMYAGLPDKQEEVGNEVRKLRTQMVEMLSLQKLKKRTKTCFPCFACLSECSCSKCANAAGRCSSEE